MDNQISSILAERNPLEVPAEVSMEEYQAYIPHVKKRLNDEGALLNYLEHIVTDNMGLSYDHHD